MKLKWKRLDWEKDGAMGSKTECAEFGQGFLIRCVLLDDNFCGTGVGLTYVPASEMSFIDFPDDSSL